MVNKVILIGNVGMEPEVRALETGVKMARLRVATSERIYNSSTGERRDHTEWHTVVLWRGQADFAEKYIHKGSQVYIEGKIRSREWTDEASGTKRYAIEILVDEIRLLGSRSSAAGTSAGTPQAQPSAAAAGITQAPAEKPAGGGSSAPSGGTAPGGDIDDLPF